MAKAEDTLVLDTTQGKVVIAMRPDLAPKHVARIKELVQQGFYDGVAFHRVILPDARTPALFQRLVGRDLDFDLAVEHEIGAHRGAGRRVFGEELAIDLVVADEIPRILEPYRHLHDVGERAVDIPKRALDVLQHLPRFGLDAPASVSRRASCLGGTG